MAKVIKFLNPATPEIKTDDRQIRETEDVTQAVERTYTLKSKQEEIDLMNAKILKLQTRVPELEAELAAIKTELGVT